MSSSSSSSPMHPLALQNSTRQNSLELQNTLHDLVTFTKDMKKKDEMLSSGQITLDKSYQPNNSAKKNNAKSSKVRNSTPTQSIVLPSTYDHDFKQYNFHKDRGNEYFKSSQYDDAIIQYTQCILLLASYSPIPYSNRAQCYIQLQQYSVAIDDCNQALSIDENHMKSLYRRALSYKHMKLYDQALVDIEKILHLESNNKQAIQLRSDIQLLMKQQASLDRTTATTASITETHQTNGINKHASTINPATILPQKHQTQRKQQQQSLHEQQPRAESTSSSTTTAMNGVSNGTPDEQRKRIMIQTDDDDESDNDEELATQPTSSTSLVVSAKAISPTHKLARDIASVPLKPTITDNTFAAAQRPLSSSSNTPSNNDILTPTAPPSPSSTTPTQQSAAATSLSATAKSKFTVPRTASEFQVTYRGNKQNVNDLATYFALLKPSTYPSLLKTMMDTEFLSIWIDVWQLWLSDAELQQQQQILETMSAMSSVPRFTVASMMLDRKDKTKIKNILRSIMQMSVQPDESADIKKVGKMYDVLL